MPPPLPRSLKWKFSCLFNYVPFFLMIGQTACHGKAHKTLIQTVQSQWLGQNLYENLQESTSSQLQWRVEVILPQGLEVWNLPYQKLRLKHHVSTIVLLDAWASPEKWGIGLVPCLLLIQPRRGYGSYLLCSEAGIASLGIIIMKGWFDGLKSLKIYLFIPHFLSFCHNLCFSCDIFYYCQLLGNQLQSKSSIGYFIGMSKCRYFGISRRM